MSFTGFENPPDSSLTWNRHIIDNSFQKYDDQAVGDVDNGSEEEILVPSQKGQVLVYYHIPPRPQRVPREDVRGVCSLKLVCK